MTKTIAVTAAFLWLGMGGPLPAQDAAATPQYVVTDLGTLGGSDSDAYAINNAGHVVGAAQTAGGQNHAFLWKDDHMEDLGGLPNSDASVAQAISDTNLIAGQCRFSALMAKDSHSVNFQAALWKKGQVIGLGEATLTGSGVNNKGQVVGSAIYDAVKNITPGFQWSDGHLSLLQQKAGFSFLIPQGINDQGMVVGSAWVPQSDERHPVLWSGKQIMDLGAPGESGTFGALAINRAGQVAGQSGQDAFLWTKGRRTLLARPSGTRYGVAWGLNNRGQVVGSVEFSTSDYGDSHAFLWENGRAYKLEDCLEPGAKWTLKEARGINDRGQIVGCGSPQGKAGSHALLLTPKNDPPRHEALP